MAPTRQCTIEFVNTSSEYDMCSPGTYKYSGFCEIPPSPDLQGGGPSDSGRAVFVKTPNTMWGDAGVVAYDLMNKNTHECDGRMAVMFSNPYNFMSFENWFGVGVFSPDTNCDYNLYKKMYYKTQSGFVRGKARDYSLTYEGEAVVIRASMSDSYTPVIKVRVTDY